MNIFFTSDTHFGHANVIKFCNRPFQSVTEMNETLITNWNSVIGPSDIVYHLGDFGFSKANDFVKIVSRLNGQKHLVYGNHDKKVIKKNPQLRQMFAGIYDYKEIYVDDPTTEGGRQFIVLLHYAMRVWNKSHRGAWQLYGHSHGSLPDDSTLLAIDVGTDCHNYTPISYQQVKQIMSKKTCTPVDHHGRAGD